MPPRDLDKAALLRTLLENLEEAHEKMTASANETRRGATHEESRPENDKDTRGLEASYLARGQAQRVAELAEELARVRRLELRSFAEGAPIALGALVTLERDDGATRLLFLAPGGGGTRLLEEPEVHAVTPETPLGRALLGKRVDDEFKITLAGAAREFVVTGVT